MKAPRLFGTNGIRGVVGKGITVDLAYRVGCSVGVLFRGGRVLVGRDGRLSSPMLTEALVAGLLAQGNQVDDYGLATTPTLQFLVRASAAAAGVMITASHNPPEYNGFKVIDSDGIEIPRKKEEAVERLVDRSRWKVSRRPGQRVQQYGFFDSYFDGLKTHLKGYERSLRGLKVVVDTGNGVSSLTTPRVLHSLGCRVITLNDNIDGTFPGRSSEPLPEALSALSGVVRQEEADIGVAHDGDGDRAIFADETGRVHWGDRTFALIEDELLKRKPGAKIVTPVNSSMAIAEIAEKRDGKLVLTKVGSIYVSRTMLETGAILGGEENGGIFYAPHLPVRDGTMATLLVVKALVMNQLPLSKLLARLPRFFMAKEKIHCEDSKKGGVMMKLRSELRSKITSTLDGIRVDVKGRGWVLVRPSGTEPFIRLYAEGRTEGDLSRILDEFRPMVLGSLKK